MAIWKGWADRRRCGCNRFARKKLCGHVLNATAQTHHYDNGVVQSAVAFAVSTAAPFKLNRYSLIDLAALRPAPMARITVAPPVTISPPANTPVFEVASVSSLAAM